MIGLLGGWKGYLGAAIVGAAVALMAQGLWYGAKVSRIQASHAKTLEQQAQAVVKSVEAARAIERQHTAVTEKELDNANKQIDSLAVSLAAGAAKSDGLRSERDKLLARLRRNAADPTGPSPSEQDIDAIGVLIDMHSRMDAAGREIAEYADRLKIAGSTCEAIYDQVRSAQ